MNEIKKFTIPAKPENSIENNKIPMAVYDDRSPDIPSSFNLDIFLADLNLLMTDKDLFRGSNNKYGKYFQHATAESGNLAESLRDAKTIEVRVRNDEYIKIDKNITTVTINALTKDSELRRTVLKFNEDGSYRSGAGTIWLQIQKKDKIEFGEQDENNNT